LSAIWSQQQVQLGLRGLGLSLPLVARSLVWGVLLALGGFPQAPIAAARDVVRVESVGVAPVRSDSASPRDAAVHRGLLDAVRETAEDLLATRIGEEFAEETGDAPDPQAEADRSAELKRILGNDPLEYATRFQVVEDRGEGPTLFGSDLDVATEYVVIVSVFVDRDRIRERLTRAGILLAPPGQQPEIRSRLILENLGEYWVYAEIRRVLLEELKMRAAIPSEFSPGLAILELNAAQAPSEFLGLLQRAVSDRMELLPLSVEDDEMRLRVELLAPPASAEETEDGLAIDTRSPNRY
jgi:hypothetical protein